MPIANSDYVVGSFPGISAAGQPSPGTQGASGPAPDDRPASFTPPSGTWQARPSTTTGTVQPGQLDEGLSGLGPDFTATSGAGRGHTDAWPRHSWQQKPGPTS